MPPSQSHLLSSPPFFHHFYRAQKEQYKTLSPKNQSIKQQLLTQRSKLRAINSKTIEHQLEFKAAQIVRINVLDIQKYIIAVIEKKLPRPLKVSAVVSVVSKKNCFQNFYSSYIGSIKRSLISVNYPIWCWAVERIVCCYTKNNKEVKRIIRDRLKKSV